MGSKTVIFRSAAAVAFAGVAILVFLRPPLDTSDAKYDAQAPLADWLMNIAAKQTDTQEHPKGPWTLDLPHDHAPHPDTRSESWQLLAHLNGEDGAPLGVQLSVFRAGLMAPDAADPGTDWTPRDIYRAHVVVLDQTMHRAAGEERLGRGMAHVAGYDPDLRELRLDHWALNFGTTGPNDSGPDAPWRLRASAGGVWADLVLTPEKPPTIGAINDAPFRGYALSRLRVKGQLKTAEGRQTVSGVAWLDHLWGDLPIPGAAPVVSDLLQLHLDDGSEVSVIRSRRQDGRGTPTVDAVQIAADGAATVFDDNTAEVGLTRVWQGAAAEWPVDWSLRLGDLNLSVTPVVDDQEQDFMAPVWSGLVRATGQRGKRQVTGMGTLQLTGYDVR